MSFYEAEIPMSTNWVQHFWLENKAQAENNLQTNFSNENHNMMVAPRSLTSLIHEEAQWNNMAFDWQVAISYTKFQVKFPQFKIRKLHAIWIHRERKDVPIREYDRCSFFL